MRSHLAIAALVIASSSTQADDLTGEQIYQQQCVRCHGPKGEGTDKVPAVLAGDRSIRELTSLIAETMPEDNPGSLKQQEYADILAYFLSLNAYPTGDAELAPGAGPMASIKIEKKK